MSEILFRPFQEYDQAAARALILQGLGAHFGFIDETLNPDLNDIAAHYIRPGHLFLLAEMEGQIVGTGALINAAPKVAQMVRVSVCHAQRRHGIGRAMVTQLVQAARRHGYRRVQVETNKDWFDAIGLYRSCGFNEYARDDVSVYMALGLAENRD
ncbi:MAG TPA: GNAT family N-acetyltransferase [Anaerolineae bacterium]